MNHREIVLAAMKDAEVMHAAHEGRDGGVSIVNQTASCEICDNQEMKLYVMVHAAVTQYLDKDTDSKTETHYERS